MPFSHIVGMFTFDSTHKTFTFTGVERFLDTYVGGCTTSQPVNSLETFYERTNSVLWVRKNQNGYKYMGGTEFAANGAPVRRDLHTGMWLSFVGTGIGIGDLISGALSRDQLKISKGFAKILGSNIAYKTMLSGYAQSVEVQGRLRALDVQVP
jgi:hypothetical protein